MLLAELVLVRLASFLEAKHFVDDRLEFDSGHEGVHVLKPHRRVGNCEPEESNDRDYSLRARADEDPTQTESLPDNHQGKLANVHVLETKPSSILAKHPCNM